MATLRMFASAREAAGTSQAEFAGATVGDVLAAAVTSFGEGFARVLPSCRVWVNGEAAEAADPVGAADEVAVLPPVSGGC
ncbi:MAG TPA: MoaD/ThiS family protein [Ilumatobacteraceae bacterium]|jgi:sulfur-carrier protein|nr:MoaD/ThiS family protein [Ilumatobacteraceae bacterium]